MYIQALWLQGADRAFQSLDEWGIGFLAAASSTLARQYTPAVPARPTHGHTQQARLADSWLPTQERDRSPHSGLTLQPCQFLRSSYQRWPCARPWLMRVWLRLSAQRVCRLGRR